METLPRAMGHASIATTVDLYGHLDLADVVRDLALVEARTGINPGAETLSCGPKARTGFEPVFSEEGDEGSLGREQSERSAPELPADLLRIVQRLTQASRKGRP